MCFRFFILGFFFHDFPSQVRELGFFFQINHRLSVWTERTNRKWPDQIGIETRS